MNSILDQFIQFDLFNEQNLNNVLFKYWLDNQSVKNMFDTAVDKTSTHCGQCIASFDYVPWSGKTHSFFSIHYIKRIKDDSTLLVNLYDDALLVNLCDGALLVNLYDGEQIFTKNCTLFDPDILNCHAFSKARDVCNCSEFSKFALQYRFLGGIWTKEEHEIFEKMSAEADYELAHNLDPNSLDYLNVTPRNIYIENCFTISYSDLQILNKLNIIEQFDNKKLCCYVHDAMMP
jgi:hypothetical protein